MVHSPFLALRAWRLKYRYIQFGCQDRSQAALLRNWDWGVFMMVVRGSTASAVGTLAECRVDLSDPPLHSPAMS